MECPFKRNVEKRYEYEWNRNQNERKIEKEIITVTFGECSLECAFYDFYHEGCKFKGNYPNI